MTKRIVDDDPLDRKIDFSNVLRIHLPNTTAATAICASSRRIS